MILKTTDSKGFVVFFTILFVFFKKKLRIHPEISSNNDSFLAQLNE